MDRIDLSNDVVELGTVIAETRGPSTIGQPDTNHVLNFLAGLSDED